MRFGNTATRPLLPTRSASRARVQALGVGCLAVLGAIVAQGAQRTAADIGRGEQIARSQCAACHVVAKDQQYPPLLRDPAPSFASIAARPGTTARKLTNFISTTHWDLKSVPITMPDQRLSDREVKAVVDYILTLKPAA